MFFPSTLCHITFAIMNYLDIILIIPLLWGLYKGFSKGLIVEAALLIAFGLAVWGGIKFSDFLSGWMKGSLGWDSKYLPLISFAVIFIGVLLIVFGIAKLVERFAKAVSLGVLNKLGGAVFSMLKFGLLMSMIIFFIEAINKTVLFIPDETKKNSLLYEQVQKIAPTIIPGLRESKLGEMMPKIDSVNAKVDIK